MGGLVVDSQGKAIVSEFNDEGYWIRTVSADGQVESILNDPAYSRPERVSMVLDGDDQVFATSRSFDRIGFRSYQAIYKRSSDFRPVWKHPNHERR